KAFSNIGGEGTVVLKGSEVQSISVNGNTISNLVLDNEAGASVNGSLQLSDSLQLKKGIFNINDGILTFSERAVALGAAGSFVNTNTSGYIRKMLPEKPASFVAPLGYQNISTPIVLTTVRGFSGAYVDLG